MYSPVDSWVPAKKYEGVNMTKRFLNFLSSDEGTTSIEYALIAGLIFVVIVLAVTDLGGTVVNLFQTVADKYPR